MPNLRGTIETHFAVLPEFGGRRIQPVFMDRLRGVFFDPAQSMQAPHWPRLIIGLLGKLLKLSFNTFTSVCFVGGLCGDSHRFYLRW